MAFLSSDVICDEFRFRADLCADSIQKRWRDRVALGAGVCSTHHSSKLRISGTMKISADRAVSLQRSNAFPPADRRAAANRDATSFSESSGALSAPASERLPPGSAADVNEDDAAVDAAGGGTGGTGAGGLHTTTAPNAPAPCSQRPATRNANRAAAPIGCAQWYRKSVSLPSKIVTNSDSEAS